MTALASAEEVQPFDRFWSAARDVVPGASSPPAYVHVRLGERGALASAVEAAGWTDVSVTRLSSTVIVNDAELWAWLWQALPIRRDPGGEYLDDAARAPFAAAIRERLRSRCAGDRLDDGRYRFTLAAWLVAAVNRNAAPC